MRKYPKDRKKGEGYEPARTKSEVNQDFIPAEQQIARMLKPVPDSMYDTKEGELISDEIIERRDITRSGDFDLADYYEIEVRLAKLKRKIQMQAAAAQAAAMKKGPKDPKKPEKSGKPAEGVPVQDKPVNDVIED